MTTLQKEQGQSGREVRVLAAKDVLWLALHGCDVCTMCPGRIGVHLCCTSASTKLLRAYVGAGCLARFDGVLSVALLARVHHSSVDPPGEWSVTFLNL